MKKHLFLLLLSAMALLLQGCQRVHCPCYPQDDTGYLPMDFVGQTMRYIYDGDTIAFKIAPPEFSEEYDKPYNHDIQCEAYAQMDLKSSDENLILSYSMNSWHSLSVCLQKDGDYMSCGRIEDIYDEWDNGSRRAEDLPQWTSPTGYTYTDVVKSTEMITAIGIDTLYLSKRYGLLHWYIHGGHTLTLLP